MKLAEDQAGWWWCTKLWLALVTVFALGRLFYFTAYYDLMARSPWSILDLIRVFLSGARFDGSAAAGLTLPPLAFVTALSVVRRLARVDLRPRVTFAFKAYAGLAVTVSWILIVVDHYYFMFYRDH